MELDTGAIPKRQQRVVLNWTYCLLLLSLRPHFNDAVLVGDMSHDVDHSRYI